MASAQPQVRPGPGRSGPQLRQRLNGGGSPVKRGPACRATGGPRTGSAKVSQQAKWISFQRSRAFGEVARRYVGRTGLDQRTSSAAVPIHPGTHRGGKRLSQRESGSLVSFQHIAKAAYRSAPRTGRPIQPQTSHAEGRSADSSISTRHSEFALQLGGLTPATIAAPAALTGYRAAAGAGGDSILRVAQPTSPPRSDPLGGRRHSRYPQLSPAPHPQGHPHAPPPASPPPGIAFQNRGASASRRRKLPAGNERRCRQVHQAGALGQEPRSPIGSAVY